MQKTCAIAALITENRPAITYVSGRWSNARLLVPSQRVDRRNDLRASDPQERCARHRHAAGMSMSVIDARGTAP
jgi:hypothetical protein